MSLKSRYQNIMKSFFSVPKWVQIWVGAILIPTNTLFVFFLDTDIGVMNALASAFVVATNVPIALYYQGMTKLMSIPHLIWIPLEIYIIQQLMTGDIAVGSSVFIYAIIVLVVNAVSVFFDVMDSISWIKGDRGVPGL